MSNRLKKVLDEKCCLAAYIVTCTLCLAAGLSQGCSGIGTALQHDFALH